ALRKLKKLEVDSNRVNGGPAEGESLESWRARLRQQEQAAVRENPQPENPAARTSSSTPDHWSAARTSSSTPDHWWLPSRRRATPSSSSEKMYSADRAALVALFLSTDGANWKRKNNWNTDAGLASWAGIKLNHAGRVVKLSLPDNNLH
ncbi:unnamed protein product, partial [Ectocarpus fasciculatus]